MFNNNYQSGQNVPPEEASRLAVESAIKYHQTMKVQNSEVWAEVDVDLRAQ